MSASVTAGPPEKHARWSGEPVGRELVDPGGIFPQELVHARETPKCGRFAGAERGVGRKDVLGRLPVERIEGARGRQEAVSVSGLAELWLGRG